MIKVANDPLSQAMADYIADPQGSRVCFVENLPGWTRDQMIREAWAMVQKWYKIDFNAVPICRAIPGDASEVLVFERCNYDNAQVVECDGRVVHTIVDLQKKCAYFAEYRKARRLWDYNKQRGRTEFAPALERKIERLETQFPDFAEAYTRTLR